MKNNVIIHFDWFELFEESDLSEDEQNELIFAAIEYARHDTAPAFTDRALKAVWSVMRDRIDSDTEKYEKRAAASRENGKRGGRPKALENEENKNPVGLLGSEKKPSKTYDNLAKPSKPIYVTVTDSDIDNNVSECVTSVTSVTSVTTHTREKVKAFFEKQGFRSDPDRFIDYNIGKGNEAIFNNTNRWQAVARNWEKMEKDRHPPNKSKYINYDQRDTDLDAIAEGRY